MATGEENTREYFVKGEGDQQYGPATLPTLKDWVAQGRILPTTILVNAMTKEEFPARELQGLFDAQADAPPVQPAPPRQEAPSASYQTASDVAEPVRKRSTPVWLIVIIAVGGICAFGCVILAAILFPVFAQAKLAAKQTQTLSNLKQLSTGVLLYSSDFDDCFPRDMSSAKALQPVLTPYNVPASAFSTLNSEGGEILGNGKLSGKPLTALMDPRETVMIYDSKAWQGMGLAAFTDGHARKVRPYEDMIARLEENPFMDEGASQ